MSRCPYDVRPINIEEMTDFVAQHHYSKVMPPTTKVCYGGFRDGELVAAISFGWGCRPDKTIQKIFPSLDTPHYLEIGKMCLADSEPRNSETQFMAVVRPMLSKQFPDVRLIFTWADGMWGKPGYVYQAENYLYGGYIWTDVYQTADGQRIHPLQLQSEMKTCLRVQRPNSIEMAERGWARYSGKQFRYVRFVCDNREQQRLLSESNERGFSWTASREGYPKDADLEWRQWVDGKKVRCAQPRFTGTYSAGTTEATA